MEEKKPFISRVIVKNYKSIARCDVNLGSLRFLVGCNGSGKSNFLDALAFVRDALADDLNHAFNIRQGINQVRRRSGGHPTNFGVYLEFNLASGENGHFGFELTAKKDEGFKVKEERGSVEKNGKVLLNYRTCDGKVDSSGKVDNSGHTKERLPPLVEDRLYLQNMAAFDEYQPVYNALRTMRIYNINPKLMAEPQKADTETLLKDDGSNIAASIAASEGKAKRRICEYLQSIVPFVSDFAPRETLGKAWQIVEFRQTVQGLLQPWRFPAINMSDGTLRALGILTGLLQKRKEDTLGYPALVGIEEPETALHARAAGALLSALEEASSLRQVILTTHSTEILAEDMVTPDKILPVELRGSETIIGELGEATKGMLWKHLVSAGELLRQDMLQPDEDIFPSKRLPLFPKGA